MNFSEELRGDLFGGGEQCDREVSGAEPGVVGGATALAREPTDHLPV